MKLSDMLFANAMGEGGGGGGGGDIPFKTATIKLSADGYAQLDARQLEASSVYSSTFYFDSAIDEWHGFDKYATVGTTDETMQMDVIICFIGDSVEVGVYGDVVSVSGDASYDADTQTFTISGDCTITLHSID